MWLRIRGREDGDEIAALVVRDLVNQEELIAFATSLPGVAADTASEESGAPEVAWGDTFFFYDPGGVAHRTPFATIVVKDYPGWDEASNVNRPGVFRLNLAPGKAAFDRLFAAGEYDYTALDKLFPHPVYADQHWVSVLNPDTTEDQVKDLFRQARDLAQARHERRHG
jgi:Family of unknown function (DUF6194)